MSLLLCYGYVLLEVRYLTFSISYIKRLRKGIKSFPCQEKKKDRKKKTDLRFLWLSVAHY